MKPLDIIPKNTLREIAFMLGDSTECERSNLKPILEKHGYGDLAFIPYELEEIPALVLDVYNILFVTGIFQPWDYGTENDDVF